jgi:anhydro-N-acetylmuramic acid kinase
LLFREYDYCLNLGGIANISHEQGGKLLAFDICPVNIVLNYLASMLGKKYDSDGEIASKGIINSSILQSLGNLNYYKKVPPKSLGREWIEMNILPLVKESSDSIENKLCTVVEHIASQIAFVVNPLPKGKMLVTGGGAKNTFLIDVLKTKINSEVVVPDPEIIDFKEALIFAFLGILRWRKEINTLSSVTGAIKDSCGGSIVCN